MEEVKEIVSSGLTYAYTENNTVLKVDLNLNLLGLLSAAGNDHPLVLKSFEEFNSAKTVSDKLAQLCVLFSVLEASSPTEEVTE